MSPPVATSVVLPPSEPVLPLGSVVGTLRSGMADTEWLLGEIESQEGWFRFPPFFTNAIRNLRIEGYPLLYTNEASISVVLLKGFMTDEEIREFCAEMDAASLPERGEFLTEFATFAGEFVETIEIPKTPQAQEAANVAFLALSPEEQAEAIKISQHTFMFALTAFHQSLSIMVHGEKLTALVAQAIAGNDDAYVKAIQIDKRILSEIPYFKQRFAQAQSDADSDFFDLVSYRLKTAPYRGKIRHKSLWYAFSVLEQAGWLNALKHRELLDICDEVGIGGYKNRIQSEKHLANRLRDYREFQKRGIVATT